MYKSFIIIICVILTFSAFGFVGCGSAVDEDLIGAGGVIQTGNPTRPRPGNPANDPYPEDDGDIGGGETDMGDSSADAITEYEEMEECVFHLNPEDDTIYFGINNEDGEDDGGRICCELISISVDEYGHSQLETTCGPFSTSPEQGREKREFRIDPVRDDDSPDEDYDAPALPFSKSPSLKSIHPQSP